MTGIIYAFHLYPTIPNTSIVYLLVILVLASTRGRYAAILAAVSPSSLSIFSSFHPFYNQVYQMRLDPGVQYLLE